MTDVALSVVIVSWMSREHIARCLDSVERSAGGLAVETWLVDNDSADGTADFVASAYPRVRLVRNRENVGFARAANQALSAARGRHCLLLNPDAEVLGDALPALVAFMDANPRAGIVTGRLENLDGTIQRGCRRLLPTPRRLLWRLTGLTLVFPRSALFGDYNMTHAPEDRVIPVEAVSGAFLVIRREVMERVGLMDESFFMYGEDLDWCARVGAAGGEILYFPGARVAHVHKASSRKNRARTIRALHEAGELYYRKHLAASSPALLTALVIGSLRFRCSLLLAKERLAARVRPGREETPPSMEGTALVRNLR